MSPNHLLLHGCRHDILGHYLKAIGLLRVLAKCAAPEHCDPEAEGWWDVEKACFCLRSTRYPTREKLVDFFAMHYQPTAFFSPWNTGGGLDEKEELVLSIDRRTVAAFLWQNRRTLKHHGFKGGRHRWKDGSLNFDLKNGPVKLPKAKKIVVRTHQTTGRRPKEKVTIEWRPSTKNAFTRILQRKLSAIQQIAKVAKTSRDKIVAGNFDKDVLVAIVNGDASQLKIPTGLRRDVRTKEGGKKAVMANLVKLPNLNPDLRESLNFGRIYFDLFNGDDADPLSLLEEMRTSLPPSVVESIDAVLSTKAGSRPINNPLFLNRGMGEGGNDEMFRQFWVMFLKFAESPKDPLCATALMGEANDCDLPGELGFPFFPDAIKSYNQGGGWVQNSFKFNPLDYVLAMEGAFALRGSVARKLGTNARRFAAFPFIFETGDSLTDGKDMKSAAAALWLPIWTRGTSFNELSSFIADAQARLPSKEVRFSAELMRALHTQGVDAGFTGWQEFRFKMKMGRVPWVTTGAYVQAEFREDATRLNHALQPFDESQFLDQFDPYREPNGKLKKDGPHLLRESINAAMETATRETTPHHCLDLLCAIFRACRQMAISESFRGTLPGKRARFFRPLPMDAWRHLLREMDQPEFRIARAVASMRGEQQRNGDYSKVLPMLGSLLPLKLGPQGWYLPAKGDGSKQAVWSGNDLCCDLAAILARRYLDSLSDDRPALKSPHDSLGAYLGDVLAFLNRELDDHLIARWIEALSLIGWDSTQTEGTPIADQRESHAIPTEYAALRTLLELECEWQGMDASAWQKRRSQQPIALLCQRSASTLSQAVTEALHWIAIWGVRNPDREATVQGKERLAGRDIFRLRTFAPSTDATRLAAAVCIPIHRRDRRALYRAVSLPQGDGPSHANSNTQHPKP